MYTCIIFNAQLYKKYTTLVFPLRATFSTKILKEYTRREKSFKIESRPNFKIILRIFNFVFNFAIIDCQRENDKNTEILTPG